MFDSFRDNAVVAATAAALVLGGSSGAHAGPADPPAFTLYGAVVQADALANVADTSASVGDNITCDPVPVVDGHMLNPRAGVVVGEVYGQAEIAAHWKCASLDTGATYTVHGVVTDWYFSGGTYMSGENDPDNMTALAGVGTVNPNLVVSYPGGSPALNTWHYARFTGTTTTGRRIVGVSPLFYVAGV